MGCDMVVALPAATNRGETIFGANLHRPVGEMVAVRQVPGKTFALGEALKTQNAILPQVRQTFAVLALQTSGNWGYLHGINESRVAVGFSNWQCGAKSGNGGLLGTDLVRLTLERSHSAGHALDVLCGLISRYSLGALAGDGEGADHVFLLADPGEAYAVEATGWTWAVQEVHQVRAASDVAVIRQDWHRLAGLGRTCCRGRKVGSRR